MGAARIGRESTEVLIKTVGAARVGRESVEVLVVTPGAARVGRMSVEVLIENVASGPPPFVGWGVPLV